MRSRLSAAARPPRPLVYGHRGCGRAPENTIAAFDLALDAGADGLEMDVRLSQDGVLVVHHDSELDRCTNGTGPVAALAAGDLCRLDAGYRYDLGGAHPYRGLGITIPRLDEVLERYPATPIIVEVKSYSRAAAHAIVRSVRAAHAEDRICVAAFDHDTLRTVRRLAPEIATSASRDEVFRALCRSWFLVPPPRRRPYRAVQVPEAAERRRVVSRRFVRLLHRAGVSIQVWTVNAEPDMRRLLAWGVDGLITDRPELAVRIRDEVITHAGASDR